LVVPGKPGFPHLGVGRAVSAVLISYLAEGSPEIGASVGKRLRSRVFLESWLSFLKLQRAVGLA
jgi:hypothetical protein